MYDLGIVIPSNISKEGDGICDPQYFRKPVSKIWYIYIYVYLHIYLIRSFQICEALISILSYWWLVEIYFLLQILWLGSWRNTWRCKIGFWWYLWHLINPWIKLHVYTHLILSTLLYWTGYRNDKRHDWDTLGWSVHGNQSYSFLRLSSSRTYWSHWSYFFFQNFNPTMFAHIPSLNNFMTWLLPHQPHTTCASPMQVYIHSSKTQCFL